MNPLLEMLAEDKATIAYRPRLNQLTGSVTATILLQQILYWYKQMDCKPFYKFKESCEHREYKPGDSWCEELGFTRREFDTALSRIAIKRNKNNREDGQKAYAYYWITPQRMTFYTIDEEYLVEKLIPLYSVKAENADTKSTKTPLPKGENGSTKRTKEPVRKDDIAGTKSENQPLYNTEITPEITSKIYLIVIGAEKDKKFTSAFNDFTDRDDNKGRSDTFYWISHNSEKYQATLPEIINALEISTAKDKQGDVGYFTGVLRKKAESRGSGLTGFGKPDYWRVDEYLRDRLKSHIEDGYLVNYDLSLNDGILYYSVASREDREPVADLMEIVTAELEREFKIKLQPKFRI